MPSRGDFVAFRWAGGGPYPAGVTFIKVLAGMPGDEVTRDARGFYRSTDRGASWTRVGLAASRAT